MCVQVPCCLAVSLGVVAFGTECAEDQSSEPATLHNVIEVTPGVINGSAPEGQAGFDALAKMGVKTIISVDGVVPDIDAATNRGM